jgi:hypothetical protein
MAYPMCKRSKIAAIASPIAAPNDAIAISFCVHSFIGASSEACGADYVTALRRESLCGCFVVQTNEGHASTSGTNLGAE